jgi:hypothetical protein
MGTLGKCYRPRRVGGTDLGDSFVKIRCHHIFCVAAIDAFFAARLP